MTVVFKWFLQVLASVGSKYAASLFIAQVVKIPEVLKCFSTTYPYSFFWSSSKAYYVLIVLTNARF